MCEGIRVVLGKEGYLKIKVKGVFSNTPVAISGQMKEAVIPIGQTFAMFIQEGKSPPLFIRAKAGGMERIKINAEHGIEGVSVIERDLTLSADKKFKSFKMSIPHQLCDGTEIKISSTSGEVIGLISGLQRDLENNILTPEDAMERIFSKKNPIATVVTGNWRALPSNSAPEAQVLLDILQRSFVAGKIGDNLVRLNEAAEIIGCHASTLRHWRREGKITVVSKGPRKIYLSKGQLEKAKKMFERG